MTVSLDAKVLAQNVATQAKVLLAPLYFTLSSVAGVAYTSASAGVLTFAVSCTNSAVLVMDFDSVTLQK